MKIIFGVIGAVVGLLMGELIGAVIGLVLGIVLASMLKKADQAAESTPAAALPTPAAAIANAHQPRGLGRSRNTTTPSAALNSGLMK